MECLLPNEVRKIQNLIKDFNLPDDILSSKELSEVIGTEMKLDPKGGICYTINESLMETKINEIHNFIKTSGDKYKQIRDWYHNVHNMVVSNLGETKASIFLGILAITSMQNAVEANTIEAMFIYTALLNDFKKQPEKTKEFLNTIIGTKDKKDIPGMVENYGDLETYQIFESNIGQSLLTKIKNSSKLFKFVVDNDFKVGLKEVTQWLMTHIAFAEDNPRMKSKSMKFVDDKPTSKIGGFKVFSFIMNLLDPDYKYQDKKQFSTIDTHMIKFLLPEEMLNVVTKSKKAASRVFTNGDDLYNKHMLFVNHITNIMKTKYDIDLLPNQLQAIGWYIALEKYKGNVGADYISTMKWVSKEMDIEHQDNQYMLKELLADMDRAKLMNLNKLKPKRGKPQPKNQTSLFESTDMTKTEVKKILKKEIEAYFKKNIEKEVRMALKSNKNEKAIKEIVADAHVNLYRTLWNRKGFWTKSL